LAEYADHHDELRAVGANIVAVSVDPPEKSEAVRRALHLPFAILCDTSRRVVQDWDIYNAKEKGGIAKPAVFILDPGRVVRFASVDSVAVRVPAAEIAAFVRNARKDAPAPKFQFPHVRNFFDATRSSIRLGIKSPHTK